MKSLALMVALALLGAGTPALAASAPERAATRPAAHSHARAIAPRASHRAVSAAPVAPSQRKASVAREAPSQRKAPAAPEAPRRLEDIHIEGEIPVPQVLFITAREQRRFLEFQHHRYLRSSLRLGEATVPPSRVVVTSTTLTPIQERPR